MSAASPDFPAQLEATLEGLDSLSAAAAWRLTLALAELVLEQAPPGSREHLSLARRHLAGEEVMPELREAQQACWSYAVALACGCSASDSASAQAVLVCLDPRPDAHDRIAVAEQVARVVGCGVAPERVLEALRSEGFG